MKKLNKVIKIAFHNATIKKATIVSLVVGTILNSVHQGTSLFSHHLSAILIIKGFLTYATPFIVSIYSTTTALMNKEYAINK